MDDLARDGGTPWYRDAVVYALDVGVYADADGDGVGDLSGAIERLDHVARLGATCVWLLPTYPSGNRDNGYDVVDHRGVDPRFGSEADLRAFVHRAHELGLRVLLDLVVNHTSDRHPWFQSAQRDADSPYRGYYVWRDTPPDRHGDGATVMFPGVEDSAWERDDAVGLWYLHHFYAHEPDLDTANPLVVEEVLATMRHWLAAGVDGFRLDALPYAVQKADPDGFSFVRRVRATFDELRPDGLLFAECDVEPERYTDYVAAGCHALLSFWTNNHLFLALARGSAEPLARALRRLGAPPAGGQWVNWVRNLDELDLEQLSPDERDEVFAAFAPEEQMRAYGRGVRRRLPPMLDGDRHWTELAYAVTAGLPGALLLSYGEEIGLGDDLDRPEREAVRVPMQWSAAANAGFSAAPSLARPLVHAEGFRAEQVNVADQERDEHSLLCRMRALLHARRDATEIGAGTWQLLPAPDSVLALRYDAGPRVLVTLANLSRDDVVVPLPDDLSPRRARAVACDREYPARAGGAELAGHGYRWLRWE